jgi:hypothetical protein
MKKERRMNDNRQLRYTIVGSLLFGFGVGIVISYFLG